MIEHTHAGFELAMFAFISAMFFLILDNISECVCCICCIFCSSGCASAESSAVAAAAIDTPWLAIWLLITAWLSNRYWYPDGEIPCCC